MSDMERKYQELGGANGMLGNPVSEEQPCPDGKGRFRHYEDSSIYRSPDTGAHEIHFVRLIANRLSKMLKKTRTLSKSHQTISPVWMEMRVKVLRRGIPDMMRKKIGKFIRFLPIILILFLAACQPKPENVSLRIATYNTHLISPLMRCAGELEVEEVEDLLDPRLPVKPPAFLECLASVASIAPDEAKGIAQKILTADYDVIALNEVFDNDAKDTLVDNLRGTYPHYVSNILFGSALEDSGLMIFSKFPFLPLPNTTYQSDVEGTTKDVAFELFEDFKGFDRHADKGAALVRVQVDSGGQPGRIYTIIFTHFQADSGNEGIRAKQFIATAQMANITLVNPDGENMFLMGDLNIFGEGAQWDFNTAIALAGQAEWQDFAKLINDPNKNGMNVSMVDGWASFIPIDDKGISFPSSEHRYDYILANDNFARDIGCLQHMTVRNMGPSDHLAVSADINVRNKLCNPNVAWRNPPLDTPLNRLPGTTDDITQIANPGAMQWFFVDLSQSTTVSIAVDKLFDPGTGQGIDIELYTPNDFSTPIPWYLEEYGVTSIPDMPDAKYKKYITPDQFYIRVFSPNRFWTGNYTIGIHEHDCSSIEDACILSANNPLDLPNLFTANQIVGVEDKAWFQIDITEQADSGAAQPLTFFVDGLSDSNAFDMNFFDKQSPANTISIPNQSFSSTQSRLEVQGETAVNLHTYLVLQRTDPAAGSPITVGWQTPLTRMHGDDLNMPGSQVMRLVCKDETNGTLGNEYGEDEIRLRVNVDSTGWKQIFGADYECNNENMIKNVSGVFRFLDNIQVQIIEVDDSSPDDHSKSVPVDALVVDFFAPGSFPRVLPLTIEYEFEGGEYAFYFNLSHPFPLP
jgi:endonuclease/exonuclease/phosphatase family metal-dependent hydrolase